MAKELAALIERLKEKQGNLSDADFAERLGISRQLWSLIKSGKHAEPGAKFLKAVVQTFPELNLAVMNYLATSTDKSASAVSSSKEVSEPGHCAEAGEKK